MSDNLPKDVNVIDAGTIGSLAEGSGEGMGIPRCGVQVEWGPMGIENVK